LRNAENKKPERFFVPLALPKNGILAVFRLRVFALQKLMDSSQPASLPASGPLGLYCKEDERIPAGQTVYHRNHRVYNTGGKGVMICFQNCYSIQQSLRCKNTFLH
jgi:hypothetical protein